MQVHVNGRGARRRNQQRGGDRINALHTNRPFGQPVTAFSVQHDHPQVSGVGAAPGFGQRLRLDGDFEQVGRVHREFLAAEVGPAAGNHTRRNPIAVLGGNADVADQRGLADDAVARGQVQPWRLIGGHQRAEHARRIEAPLLTAQQGFIAGDQLTVVIEKIRAGAIGVAEQQTARPALRVVQHAAANHVADAVQPQQVEHRDRDVHVRHQGLGRGQRGPAAAAGHAQGHHAKVVAQNLAGVIVLLKAPCLIRGDDHQRVIQHTARLQGVEQPAHRLGQ